MDILLRFCARLACATVPFRRGDRGQATAEYVLVMLGAAAIATLLLVWATGTGRIGSLLDAVVDSIADRVR
jgi:hypothetical protein